MADGGKYAFFGIIMGFAGTVFGASLEHGTNALCRTGIVDCRQSDQEKAMFALADSLQQCHRTLVTNAQYARGVVEVATSTTPPIPANPTSSGDGAVTDTDLDQTEFQSLIFVANRLEAEAQNIKVFSSGFGERWKHLSK